MTYFVVSFAAIAGFALWALLRPRRTRRRHPTTVLDELDSYTGFLQRR